MYELSVCQAVCLLGPWPESSNMQYRITSGIGDEDEDESLPPSLLPSFVFLLFVPWRGVFLTTVLGGNHGPERLHESV